MLKNTIRRWWDLRLQIALLGLAVTAAWGVRQTQGAALFEVYNWVTRPFQANGSGQEQLISARTQELQAQLLESEIQNQKLKELLGYVSAKKPQGIVAPIIGRSADHWWQQITLGRGSNDGIKTDFTVMGPGGLVGRVVSVTPNTSLVLLVSDPTSQLGVGITRSRNMGFMRGKGGNQAVMEFFDNVPNVKPGDVVSTSSFSQLFPAGLPVGKVVSVDMNKTPAPEAIVEFSAPMNALEWAVVYPHSKKAEQQVSQGESLAPDGGANQ
ncbi:rod shape-determining protein MreC [Tychonema sp. LEGE 07203]|uniref:rod shape-determining protein MreC n=1 Tax=Tychonema sp. LEGE 07203 TaxID=1828671 RepID=UPI0018805C9D|nr:rod shape-determining protein MreC [Tychonema sp. LEGE 07203]MBE9094468.1 rod shape-determining protein MreC [Tychonema sp. LEGE 07203]